jgi:hypothetical protein
MRMLFKVIAQGTVNTREGRVMALFPPLTAEQAGWVREGDALELRRPDGTLIGTRVRGLFQTMLGPHIVLGRMLMMHEVPRGTEVWAVGEEGGEALD